VRFQLINFSSFAGSPGTRMGLNKCSADLSFAALNK